MACIASTLSYFPEHYERFEKTKTGLNSEMSGQFIPKHCSGALTGKFAGLVISMIFI